MEFSVFISHSVAPRELAIVYALAEEAAKRGLSPFIPDRDWDPRADLPSLIRSAIDKCHAMVVIGTNFSRHPDWVIRESTEAGSKPILFVLDPQWNVSGAVNRVNIDRSDLTATIRDTTQRLADMKLEKDLTNALTWLVVGGLLFTLFSENK